MLKIGFIIPSGKHNYEPFRNQPLTELYLLTIVEERLGDKVQLSMIDLRGIEERHSIYRIPENDVFLYSAATLSIDEISRIVQKLRSVYPNAKHIAGGAHINIFPEESATIFDTIVLGEGEELIVKAINDVMVSKLKPRYIQNKPVDIDIYPYPSRKFLPKTAVVDTGLLDGENTNLKGTAVVFSRGCPFNCYFCANKNLTFGPVRYRAPNLVKEEIEYLKKEYEIEALAIKDDNCIPFNKRFAKPFLEAIGQTKIKWRGQTRANGVPSDMVKLAKKAGCTDLAIGIESASPKVLKIINKQIDLDKAKDYIQFLNKTGIGVRVHFILGLPGEPDDIVKQTLNFINKANPGSVLLSLFCPMPGSEIFEDPKRFSVNLHTKNWDAYRNVFGRFDENEHPSPVFNYDEVTPFGRGMKNEEIIQNYEELQIILRDRGLNF
ncbi:MAG: B12-binding domain-containing radical SAM protein [Thermoplasmatales archaeon]|nr:B12-binding domain-containing radical SAM protein [Thermoplasmatales archaeon]